MLPQTALDLVTKFNEATTKAECLAHLEGFLSFHGVARFAIAEFTGPIEPNLLREGNVADEWMEHYFINHYEYIDPVAQSIFSMSGKDVIWKELNEIAQRKTKGWQVLNEGRDFELHDGITFPFFGPSGYVAGATFASPKFDDDPEFRAALSLIATYAHSRLVSLHREERALEQSSQLTGREREVVHWIAAGKSDWEIGEILCISEHTAKKHVENAKKKLGAPKRIQLVVEAMRHSLLRY